MEGTQAPLVTGGKGHDIPFSIPNNPRLPAQSNVCFINNLPTELICRIFELGTMDSVSPHQGEWKDYPPKQTISGSGEGGNGDDDDRNEGGDSEGKEGNEGEDEGDRAKIEEDRAEDDIGKGSKNETDDQSTSRDNPTTPSQSRRIKYVGPYPPAGRPPPVLISHVCRLWRNIAFSTPSLWTRIKAGLTEGRTYKLESMLLEQSKDLPIDFIVSSRFYGFNAEAPSYDDFRPLVSILVPHIHRWHTIKIDVEEYPLMYNFLCAVSDPSISAAPQLTTLRLSHYPWRDCADYDWDEHSSPPKHLIPFGGSVPLLTTLLLFGVHVDWSQPWIASASNLTTLHLEHHEDNYRPSWAQFAAILRGAPGLRKLYLHRSGPSGDPSEWFITPTLGRSADLNAPVQLLRLTDLTLRDIPQKQAIGLFRRLYLPALKSLRLDSGARNYNDLVLELAGPATSLSPGWPSSLLSRLESLRLGMLDCSSESVRMLYSELQNVTSLAMDGIWLSSEFLDFLGTGSTGQGSVWLPRLTTLYITFWPNRCNPRQVLQERMDAGAPITALYVLRASRVPSEQVEWLRENLKLGQWNGYMNPGFQHDEFEL